MASATSTSCLRAARWNCSNAAGNPTGIFLVDAEHDTGFVEVDVIEQTSAKLTLVGGPIGPVPQGFRLAGSSTVEVLFEGGRRRRR